MPTEQEQGGGGGGPWLSPVAALVMMIGCGVVMIVAAVWLLVGFPWALLLAGLLTLGAAALLRRGLIGNG